MTDCATIELLPVVYCDTLKRKIPESGHEWASFPVGSLFSFKNSRTSLYLLINYKRVFHAT